MSVQTHRHVTKPKTLFHILTFISLILLTSCSSPTTLAPAPTQEISLPTAAQPTLPPTVEWTQTLVVLPTEPPATQAPAENPTQAPNPTPTQAPTEIPTEAPVPTLTLEPTQAPTQTPAVVYGAIARQHLAALSNEIGARLPGSDQEYEAADYIYETFDDLGAVVTEQYFTFTDEEDEEWESTNLIVVKEGESSQQIIIGAHYDSSDEGDGADDNASGVAVLLELYELVQDVQTPYTIVFIAFGAEENDLDGSRYYASQMSAEEIANTVAMINLDSLIAGDLAYMYGDAGAGTLHEWILAQAAAAGIQLEGKTAGDLLETDGSPCDCADYGPFQELGIPFVYFEATNWNLGDQDGLTQVDQQYGEDGVIRHTSYDTVETIDQLFPGRIDQHLNNFIYLLYTTVTQYGS